MSICKDFKSKVLDYMENQMNEAEHMKFDEHLKQCSSCQKEYASLKILYEVLDRDEVVLPENEFFDNLKIRVRQKDITPRRSYVWKISRVLVPIAVAAAIVLLFYQPDKTTEIAVPVAELLKDREIASYALTRIVDDVIISELTEIEDYFLLDVDEVIDELTDEEKEEFIKDLYEKYGLET